jgi:hypothetical protein
MKTLQSLADSNTSHGTAFSELLREHGIFTDGKAAIITPVSKAATGEVSMRASRIAKQVSGLLETKTGEAAAIVAGQNGDIPIVIFKDYRNHMMVDARYVSTIKKLHPDATFHIANDIESVIAESEGKPVGVVSKIVRDDFAAIAKKTHGPKADIANFAEPSHYTPDDIEFTSTRAYTKDGKVSLPISSTEVAGIPVSSLARAKKLALKILSYSHGADEAGNPLFKPK